MKTILQKILLVSWLLISSIQAQSLSHSIAFKHGDCEPNCFKSEIVSVTQSDGCTEYQLRVFMTGDCAHALSHYTVEVPSCAEITHVSNSENWKQEIASTDPTTGLYGFKIDDIEGFGEDDSSESFLVDFTICNTTSCETDFSCWAPRVAYKASTCVYYEETEINCVNLAAHLETQDLSCNASADGQVRVIIDEGNGPFSYVWSNGGSEESIDNLEAGAYTVEVSDADGNIINLDTIIYEPEAILVSADINHASCNGMADGSIDLTVSGGRGNYTYGWSTGASVEDLDQLVSGSYIVSVTDDSGCTVSERFTIINQTNITIEGSVSKSACSNANGSIDISVAGGTTPYTFAWNNGSTSEDLTDLEPDLYRVTVTDNAGCTTSASFVVQEDNPLMLDASTTKTGCVEDNSGSIDLTVTGGEAPYTYSWTNGEITEDLENLSAGMYTVDVTDQNGCSANIRLVISNQTFDVAAEVSAVSCAGESDGSITLSPSGGDAPYTFDWSHGATEASLSGLAATLYRVTVTDAAGCSKALTYVVSEPAPITATASISNSTCEVSAYNIDIQISGGSGNYTFEWSNGESTQNISGLTVGMYTVVVTDTNGCSTSLDVDVSVTAVGCENDDGDGDDSGDGDDGGGDDDGSGDDGSDDDGSDDDGSGDGDDDGDDGSGDDNNDGDDDGGNNGGNNGNGKNCDNPFSGDIELIEVDGNCYTYSLIVDYSGEHSHGLSHLSIALDCGDLSNASNDGHWPIEEGTDPTTGLSGFKVDDISGFGEGSLSDSFETIFTVCSSDETCEEQLVMADFKVAYKYGQCVAYEDIDGSMNISSNLSAYPNPFRNELTIEFISDIDTRAVIEIYNQRGYKVKTIFEGNVKADNTNRFTIDSKEMPVDVYTYKVSTDYQVFYGRLVKY